VTGVTEYKGTTEACKAKIEPEEKARSPATGSPARIPAPTRS